ncbi:MAG: menaquinol-cytochrome c reductase cytochrome b subunit [Actinobacteria bacterium]|nr:menaquinol-cytochrome c reductase cytochrome b subunit [Actinomycetota bacterium]
MAEVPEHLLRRSAERRKALGLDGGDEGGAPPEAAAPAEPDAAPAADVAAPAAAEAGGGADVETASGTRIPAHLLERAKRRKAAVAGGEVAAGAAAATATATIAPPASGLTGPGGHTQRLLTVVKSGSIQQTKAEAQDKVHVWPHLLVVELASILILMALVTVFSAIVRAPLLSLADFNRTPNPSKAPWYFLGLQELLTMFHPMVAGVTIPGVALGVAALAPYYDKNPSNKPNDRRFAIALFTIFIMLWAVLVIIGSFFRGPGFNFVFPWKDGIYFEL